MKRSIYELASYLVSRGKKFHVNLQSKSLYINKKAIVKDGINLYNYHPLMNYDKEITVPQILQQIEELYAVYKHSRPTERSESHRRQYFKALPEHLLTDEDMLYAPVRDVAQIELELYILIMLIENKLQWNEETMGKWFWQSSFDKDLVILRQWLS